MKKVLVFILFFSLFALVIPGTSLFADINMGSRIDMGLNLYTFLPLATPAENDLTVLPVIPLFDFGFYGQFSTGILNVGIGIRDFSLIYINLFLPSVYAELNLWRVTVNAQLGGGALYLFPIYLITGPYFVPELSLWFNLSSFGKAESKLRLGLGAISLLSPYNIEILKDELIDNFTLENFTNNVIFYLGFKISFNNPWVTWKKEIVSRK
jgi:hypothetical protein